MLVNSYSKNSLIISIAKEIRSSVNALSDQIDEKKDFRVEIIRMLKLQQRHDWHSLCAAMDLLDDTEYAKQNFLRFGLAGPTKYDEVGEKYLRLYGVLNAAYLQMEAVLKLLRHTNHTEIKEARKSLADTELIKFRNIAGAHTLSYVKDQGEKNTFMISQPSLRDEHMHVLDEDSKSEYFDFREGIRDFNDLVVKKLLSVLNAFVVILEGKNKEKGAEHRENFKHLQAAFKGDAYMTEGGLVLYIVNMSEG